MKKRAHYLTGILLAAGLGLAPAAEFKFATQTLTVPDGFEVEIAASTDLVPRPVSGSFDELGRLYITDSSGSNLTPAQQTNDPTHRILCLEDGDGDGKFDKSTVYADKVMFPEGCLYYDGSVYVAAPPYLWKFTDTNGDGVADRRDIWHNGQTLTGCANDLHGPFLGPDGWLYWCKGAFAEQSYEINGQPWSSRAPHLFRARPDHGRFEPVITAGNDNPVWLAWTAGGERILCGTFFAPNEPGHRDGMIHAVYGGVWGKLHDVLDGHPRTGELMPVLTHMGPAAPCAVVSYKSTALGREYQGNIFCCQFNLHKVSRHVLVPDGATFKTVDSDFLVSDNPDFHPTDIIEDADGSLLVLDTGAWYKLCCPTSQLAKPDVLGAIYRIRRKGAVRPADPRGLKLVWTGATTPELVQRLAADSPAVVERAAQTLARRGAASVPALEAALSQAPEVAFGRQILWTLTRIEGDAARLAIRTAFTDIRPVAAGASDALRKVMLDSMGVWRDPGTIQNTPAANAAWERTLQSRDPVLQRQAAETLGRLGDPAFAIPRLWKLAAHLPADRFLEHAIIYALIELNAPALTRAGLGAGPQQRPALIALDQMPAGDLRPDDVLPFLKSGSPELRQTAAWVVGHHPEWGAALAGFFRERILSTGLDAADLTELESQLTRFIGSEAVQAVLAEAWSTQQADAAKAAMLLRLMAQPGLDTVPAGWTSAVRAALTRADAGLKPAAIAAAHALGRARNHPPTFTGELMEIARAPAQPVDVRLGALAALPRGLASVASDLFTFLLAHLAPSQPVTVRSAAAGVLLTAQLNPAQWLALADALQASGPMEVARLLPLFARQSDLALGTHLMAALKASPGLAGVQPEVLKTVAAKYPAEVQRQADALLAILDADAEQQKAHLESLLDSLPEGDVRHGQQVFNNPKVACVTCHRMGYLGGSVGPDLTAIGPTRTKRDLLEAIVYPSASFVRSYEPLIVTTKEDDQFSGVLRKDAADEVILATGAATEVRIPRSDIQEMRPGRVSVMPSGLDQQLSKQELADLIAFLKNAKSGPN
ncbi:MAG TPA: c-type cytochrome [Verrucomicrobiota bacterium]|nr:c-type cytochrome [Verrucomicrobiota bacterium]HNT13987.1 c-type cytochrome [Verrucomicrobiota bacterium]